MKEKDLVRVNYPDDPIVHGLEGKVKEINGSHVVLELTNRTFQGKNVVSAKKSILEVVIPYCTCFIMAGCSCGSFQAEQMYRNNF